jgi:hypothetical protein
MSTAFGSLDKGSSWTGEVGAAEFGIENVSEDFLRSSICSKWGRPEQRVIRQTKSRPSVW